MSLPAVKQSRTVSSVQVNPARVVNILGIGVAVSLLGDSVMYVTLPTEYAVAGIVATDVGLMLSANRLIRIFLNTPFGVLIERIPRRMMLIPSLLFGSLASLLYIIGGFWPMLLGRLLWGIAWGGLWLGATTSALDVATAENRGYTVGRLQMWMFIGIGMSSLLGGLLFDVLGYETTLLISFVVIFLACIMWWFMLPETRNLRPDTDVLPPLTVSDVPVDDVPAEVHPAVMQKRKARPDVSFNALLLAYALYGIDWLLYVGMFVSVLPVLLRERVGVEIAFLGLLVIPFITFTGILSAANTVVSLISSPLSGWLSDRTGRRWDVVVLGFGVALIAFILCIAGGGLWVILATMLVALTSGVLMTQLTALVGDYARQNAPFQQGRLLGIQNTLGDIGAAAGPLVGFAVLPFIGLDGLFIAGTLITALAIPPALWMAWHERR